VTLAMRRSDTMAISSVPRAEQRLRIRCLVTKCGRCGSGLGGLILTYLNAQTGLSLHEGHTMLDWQPISSAPFDRDLQLSVIENEEVYALIFPCRRTQTGILHNGLRAGKVLATAEVCIMRRP
jgi:hypothetical protein